MNNVRVHYLGNLDFFILGGFGGVGWLVGKKNNGSGVYWLRCWLGLMLSDGIKYGLIDMCESVKMGDTFFVRNATWMFLCGSMA